MSDTLIYKYSLNCKNTVSVKQDVWFVRRHCLHQVHKMRPIATDVARTVCVCLSACWAHGVRTMVTYTRMANVPPIARSRPVDECILRRQGRQNKTTMLPLAKLLWTVVIKITDNSYHMSNELTDDAHITATVMRVQDQCYFHSEFSLVSPTTELQVN